MAAPSRYDTDLYQLALWLKTELKRPDTLQSADAMELFALRTALQVANPQIDDLTRRIMPVLDHFMGEMLDKESILDVGCYGGWLKAFLPPGLSHGYFGVDLVPTAIHAARRFWGERFFECIDVRDLPELGRGWGGYDVVWCTQLPEPMPIAEKLLTFGARLVILEAPSLTGAPAGYNDFVQISGCNVAVYRG